MKVDWLDNAQLNGLVVLLCEYYSQYNSASDIEPVLVKEHLTQRLLTPSSAMRMLVATNNQGDVVGFTALSLFHSFTDPRPDQSRQCKVKELYVSDAYRRSGVGKQLIAKASQWALSEGCASMDWDVRSSNFRGRRFYEGMGAKLLEDSVTYRISIDEMTSLLTSEQPPNT